MHHRIPLKSWLEYDALTPWRKVLCWRAGQRKWIKRHYRKRVRRIDRQIGDSVGNKV